MKPVGAGIRGPGRALLPGQRAIIHGVDRQVRNIGLITLLLAALTIIAVVSPEHHRPSTNSAILYFALVAAAGSIVSLAVSAVPVRVIARDIGRWRDKRRRHLRWQTYHYRAVDNIKSFPSDEAIRSIGMPCIVLVLQAPRRVWDRKTTSDQSGHGRVDRLLAYAQALNDYNVKCLVRDQELEVQMERSAALARFPDEWFGRPDRYRVEWTITTPQGGIEHASDVVRLQDGGTPRDAPVRRLLATTRKLIRHLRGLDS